MTARLNLLVATLMLFLSACGDDGDNNDTILTGFSGVIIFGIIAYVIYRIVKKRS